MLFNIALDMCTKTNIESYAMAMYSPDKSTAACVWKASLKHKIVNIPLDIYTKTDIESFVMAMYSPNKSKKVCLKSIIET